MLTSQSRKTKIDLTDYDFEQDIATRLFLAHVTQQELDILEEILNSSLKIPLPILANNCEQPEENLRPFLEQLAQVGLLTIHNELITVNKDRRKAFEAEIVKFEPDFEPGIDYLQSLLRKVSIHTLPLWYAISRTTDNIFEGIIEKYLATPKIYRKYLAELQLEEEIPQQLAEEIAKSPHQAIPSQDLQERFNLSPQEFHRQMLLLEFNFVGCVTYKPHGDGWEEVVTPFAEWKNYLHHRAKRQPQTLIPENEVTPLREDPFAFTSDMTSLLHLAPLSVETGKRGYTLPTPTIENLIQSKAISVAPLPYVPYPDYLEVAIEKLLKIKLGEIKNGVFTALDSARQWQTFSPEERAQYLYPYTKQCLLNNCQQNFSERDFLSIEKALAQYIDTGWVTFEQFLKNLETPIGNAEPVTLKKIGGRRWAYVPPQYSAQEEAFTKAMIFRRFFELGFTQVGRIHNKDCFRLTEYGEAYLRRSYLELPDSSMFD